jgi:hypothetical protein
MRATSRHRARAASLPTSPRDRSGRAPDNASSNVSPTTSLPPCRRVLCQTVARPVCARANPRTRGRIKGSAHAHRSPVQDGASHRRSARHRRSDGPLPRRPPEVVAAQVGLTLTGARRRSPVHAVSPRHPEAVALSCWTGARPRSWWHQSLALPRGWSDEPARVTVSRRA